MVRSLAITLLPALLLTVSACAISGPQAGAQQAGAAAQADTSAAPAPSSSAVETSPAPSSSAQAQAPGAPPKVECDAFMEVIRRVTDLRREIQTEKSTGKAQGWADRSDKLAAEARALKLAQEDLLIENANLVTRLADLTRDLKALAQAEKGGATTTQAAHKRVLSTSEQVEVISREPAARCSGETKLVKPQAGKLSPEQIQAIVRRSFAKFRLCYEDGLKRDPKLKGAVAVRFVIGADGKVSSAASVVASTSNADVLTPSSSNLPPLPDKKVADCVVSAFKELQFPSPEGGIVSVVYPLNFTPSD